MKLPKLPNFFKTYHSGTSVIIENKKTKITVDGKDIDPKSKEGKRILAESTTAMQKGWEAAEAAMKSAEKTMDELGKIFDKI